jgi:tRNA 2-selenouridine synthase
MYIYIYICIYIHICIYTYTYMYVCVCMNMHIYTFFTRPIYVESEGRRIGNICVPDSLHNNMHKSQCIFMSVPPEERVRFLCEDYSHFINNPEILITNLSYLKDLHSKAKLDEWNILARNGQFNELVMQLLVEHYDPCYYKSLRKHYPQIDNEETLQLSVASLLPADLDVLARSL